MDGVDPYPVVAPAAHLVHRWTCSLEDIPVGADTYDLAYSYNVVEHVENVESFLAKVIEIIKPGAVYWSMSPERASSLHVGDADRTMAWPQESVREDCQSACERLSGLLSRI